MAPTISLVKCLGPTLTGQGGTEIATDHVTNEQEGFLGLFFSAEWAPNCKPVTDILIELTGRLNKEPLRIIYVSSDEDKEAFCRQVEDTPWPAVPFSEVRRRLRLLRQHRVTSLPFLILLNPRIGRCVSRLPCETLLKDPSCSRYPWRIRPLGDILTKSSIVDPEGRTVPYGQLKDGRKALYFSASWCPPCKAFTPQLIQTYEVIKSRGHPFEVLFVSSDRSEDSWKAYHRSMPWPGIDWSEEDVRKELAETLDVKGIPTLVVLDSDLSVISREGRNLVNDDPQAEGFPWRPQSVEFLREFHMPLILERPSLILFTDGDQGELHFGRDVLLPAAEEYLSDYSDEAGMALKFFVAGEDDVSDNLRDLANLDDVVPLLTIIDLAEGSKSILEKGVEISNATVHNFVTRYSNEELDPLPIEQEDTETILEEDENMPGEDSREKETNDIGEASSLEISDRSKT